MSKQRVQVWVYPGFRKKLKKEALEDDMEMIDYTKKLCREEEAWSDFKGSKRKKNAFTFRF